MPKNTCPTDKCAVYVVLGLNLLVRVLVCAQMLLTKNRLAAKRVTGNMWLIRIGVLHLCYQIDL
jgi:hypothetical protein